MIICPKPNTIMDENFMEYNDMHFASRLADKHLINIWYINHGSVTGEAGNTL